MSFNESTHCVHSSHTLKRLRIRWMVRKEKDPDSDNRNIRTGIFYFLSNLCGISSSLRKSFHKIMTLFFSDSQHHLNLWYCGRTVTSQETKLCRHGAVWPWVSLSHSLGLRFPVQMTRTWRPSHALIFSGSTNIWNSPVGTPRKEGYLRKRVSWSPGLRNINCMPLGTTKTDV